MSQITLQYGVSLGTVPTAWSIGLRSLIEKKVQDIDLEFFSQLGADDILFIDSSHTVENRSRCQLPVLGGVATSQTRCHCARSRHFPSFRLSARLGSERASILD